MNLIYDYAKCAYENKGVLFGYAALGASIAAPVAGRLLGVDLSTAAQLSGIVAGSLLLTTGAGINTVKWKYFADRRIAERGTLDPVFIRASQVYYCRATGVRVSARENGLESLLPEKDRFFF